MEPKRWKLLKQLFTSALERTPGQREKFLREACEGDESLQAGVEAMLARHAESPDFLEWTKSRDRNAFLDQVCRSEDELKRTVETQVEQDFSREETASQSVDMVSVAVPAPGEQLGPYKIEAPLGQGGMGQVFRGRDTRLGRAVALKMVRTASAANRFFREARAASALNHPNIITIYDIGDSGSNRYIAMELVQGQTLRALAENLTFDELLRVGVQTARALSAAHAAGIVHRDIKPENIMVREDGYVKVLDFGLARMDPAAFAEGDADTAEFPDDGLTAPGTLLGTVRYMSPEQGRAEAVTAATDVFSLGIVLYELAAGSHPFSAKTPREVLEAIQSAAPVLPSAVKSSIPAAFDALVLRMLQKEPRLRPTAAEVEAALSASSSRPVAVPAVPRRTVGRAVELQQLQAAYESVVAGSGLIACVAGEPGIGKTTLVGDFLKDLSARGEVYSVARGRCSERLAGAEAYLPILEFLEALLRGPGGEAATRMLQLVAPTWYLQIASAASAPSALGQDLADAQMASQERMKREFAAFLQEMCRLRPLIVFLDDLHWADVSTVDLLAYIGSRLDSMRLLLIATYRPSDLQTAKHPFLRLKLELQGRNLCREIAVEFLHREDVQQYLNLEFPGHQFPPDLPEVIHARTEGNALFVVDLARYLKEQGVIVQQEGRWILLKPPAEVARELPESVRSVIQKKIDQFSEEDRRLLAVAGVQGYEFDSSIVAKALDLDQMTVEDRLEVLEQVHGFVRLAGEREFPDSSLTLRYAFVHILYQNTLYGSLTATRKASLSGAVAGALVGAYGERSAEIASELALLFEAARNFARAADCFLQAAQNANRVYATEAADLLALRAIESAKRLNGKEQYTRLAAAALLRAQMHHPKQMIPELLADYDLAEKSALLAEDPHMQISVILARGLSQGLLKGVKYAEPEALRGLDLARRLGWEFGIAAAEGLLGLICQGAGRLDQAFEYFDRAVPFVMKGGPAPVAMVICGGLAWLHEYRLEHSETERMLGILKRREQEEPDVTGRFMHSYINGISLGNQGRVSEALASFEWMRRVAELNDEKFWLPRLPNALGWIHRELQDLEGALRLDAEGVRLGRDLQCEEAEGNSLVNLGHDYLELGDFPSALGHLDEAENVYNREDVMNRWRYYIRLQGERAAYWIARGDLRQALHHANISLEKANATVARKHCAWAHKLRGDIAMLEERAPDAHLEYRTAISILDGFPCPFIEWKILLAASKAARALHDEAAAGDLFARARHVARSLAESVKEAPLRESFLGAKIIRDMHLQ